MGNEKKYNVGGPGGEIHENVFWGGTSRMILWRVAEKNEVTKGMKKLDKPGKATKWGKKV